MKFQNVQFVEMAQSLYKSGKNGLSNLNLLSSDEQALIHEQFPLGSNRRLELYMSNGNSRMEMPESKGRNFDFRV